MIDMTKRHEIHILRRAGQTLADTAKLAGASQSSLQRVEVGPEVWTSTRRQSAPNGAWGRLV